MSLTHYKLYRSSYFIFLLAYYQQLLPLLLKKKKIWPSHEACGISASQPGIKPMPPALGAWSLNH